MIFPGIPPTGYNDGTATAWRGRDGRFDSRGENCRTAKITNEQARQIKSYPKWGEEGGLSHRQVAELVGCSPGIVRAVRCGMAYSHV